MAPAPPADPLAGHPRYRTVKTISKGRFGFVLLAEDVASAHREQVAIKFACVECAPRRAATPAAVAGDGYCRRAPPPLPLTG